jgi:hypothetical protein
VVGGLVVGGLVVGGLVVGLDEAVAGALAEVTARLAPDAGA